MEHAHQAGVIHRDVKPANLILDHRGDVWITDFGLAQVQSDARLTMTGDLMGTLRYMSPEQALAKRVTVDHRTDIYSLGATLYEMLTLQPSFSGADREELLRQIAFEESKPARRINQAIPVELETIVMKAMAKNPMERYESAEEFADDLQRFMDDRPITARRPTLVQHVSRWTRRHRGVAVTIAVAMVCAVIGLGISTAIILGALADKSEFVAQLQDEKKKTEELLVAETKAKESESKALTEVTKTRDDLAESVRLVEEARQREQITIRRERRNAYDHEIMLANVSKREGNNARARSVLLGTRLEFRNWEWTYLTRKVHDARFSFDGALTSTSKLSRRARRIHLSPQGDYLAIPVLAEAPTSYLGSRGGSEGRRQKVGIAFVSAQTGKTVYIAAPDDARRLVNGGAKDSGDIACAFAPSSAQAAVAILGKRIAVVDLSEQRELFSLDEHDKDVTCLSFSPDGKWLASGSKDKTVRIWDMHNKKCIRVYNGHAHAIREVAFCPDGSSRIVSQSGEEAQKTTNKAYLGVRVEAFISEKGGFRVRDVLDGHPAHEAGLQANDIITKVDDQDADQIQHFVDHFSSYAPGDQVKFKVKRGEEDIALEVILAEPPDWVSGPEGGQGDNIAVYRTRKADLIHVWDAASGELALPEINGQFQSWSPNGEFLAHTRWRRYAAEIVITDADGCGRNPEREIFLGTIPSE